MYHIITGPFIYVYVYIYISHLIPFTCIYPIIHIIIHYIYIRICICIYTHDKISLLYMYNIPLNIAWHLFHGFGTSARRACQLKTRSLSHPRWRRRPLLPAKLWKGGMGSREGREKPSPSFFTILIGGMFTMKHGVVYGIVLPTCHIAAIENGHRNSWFTHWKWWFSKVMVNVYQRVMSTPDFAKPWFIN